MMSTAITLLLAIAGFISGLFALKVYFVNKRNSRKLIDLEIDSKAEKVKNEVKSSDLQSLVDANNEKYGKGSENP